MQTNNHLKFMPAFVALQQANAIIETGSAERVSYSSFDAVAQLEMNRGKAVELIEEIKAEPAKEVIKYGEMDCLQQLEFNRS